jgi:anti-sigma-K factor RskA
MNDDIDAAEYVLGTLDAGERAEFSRRLLSSNDLRAAVAAWEARFLPLVGVLPDAALPEEIWARILRSLPQQAPTALKVVQGGASAGLRKSMQRWRTAALSAGAIAAALALFIVQRDVLAPSPAPTFVAAVNRGGDLPALIVRVDLGKGSVTVRPVAAQADPGHSLELWYIGDGQAPKSMGVVSGETLRMPIPAGLSADKATFALTLEPQGGSKDGKPSGAPIYAGKLVQE